MSYNMLLFDLCYFTVNGLLLIICVLVMVYIALFFISASLACQCCQLFFINYYYDFHYHRKFHQQQGNFKRNLNNKMSLCRRKLEI